MSDEMLTPTAASESISGTLRLLAALCFLSAGAIIVGAIMQQRPDVYWIGIGLLVNGSGLARRLNWARVLSVAGLAVLGAVALLDAMKHRGTDPISLIVIVVVVFAAARLWQHPEAFSRRCW